MYPPTLTDDTQPRAQLLDDTQPNPVIHRRHWWENRGRLFLGVIIIITSLTLGLTLTVLLRSPATETITNLAPSTLKSVTLNIDGVVRNVQTDATTIEQVLMQQDINLLDHQLVSPDMSEALTDGMIITVNQTRNVTISINGAQRSLNTAFDNPSDILDDADITLTASDDIWLDGTQATYDSLSQWTVPVEHIEIFTAMRITVIDGEQTQTIQSTADTIGEALFEAGLTLYLTDSLSPPADTPVTDNMTVTIDRATPITLLVDGVTVSARTNAPTVDGALAEMNAPLFGLDYVIPAGDTPITEDMTIEIIRVTEEVITETETIAYNTTYQADSSMNLDAKTTLQAGQNGTSETRIRIRYENGIETNQTIESSAVTVAPVDEIIAYGTNIVLNTIDTPEGARQYWRTFRVYATSYHPAALGGDNITAIGATLQKGIIGADPHLIPWRTEMFVPGYGVGMMADTGGPRSSPYWIDLGYGDEDWVGWHHYVDVYLLTPIPEEINYLLPEWTAIR
jgi:uncharacterized protein YabE (DUF348 family)